MKVAIFGGWGFLGSSLAKELIQGGHEVVRLSRRNGFDLLSLGDCRRQLAKLGTFDMMINCAGLVAGVYGQQQWGVEEMCANVSIHANAVILGQEAKKFVGVVTSSTYPSLSSDLSEEYIESGPLHKSVEKHGIAKRVMMSMLRHVENDWLLVCPTGIYGAGDHYGENSKVLANLIEQFKRKKPVYTRTDGTETRDWMYVSDAARGIVAAIESGANHALINITDGDCAYTNRQLVSILGETMGRQPVWFAEDRPQVPYKVLSSAHAWSCIPAWCASPKISLEDGIKMAAEALSE